jgi:predicted dehydrogenase
MKLEKVGVIGYGYWGKKLARVFHTLGALNAIIDLDPKRQQEAKEDYGVPVFEHISVASQVGSVAVATPPETHYHIARVCLLNGFHTFVEKPLAMTYKEARELEHIAERGNLKLQVGHIYLYNPGLMAIPHQVGPYELRIRFLNDKGPPSDSTKDLIWAAGPHAMSILCHFCPDFRFARIEAWRNSNELWAKILCSQAGISVFIDIADYTGVKARTVQLQKGSRIWNFDAAHPDRYDVYEVAGRANIGVIQSVHSNKEPLLAECEEFIKGKRENDCMGSNVLELLEKVQAACTKST